MCAAGSVVSRWCGIIAEAAVYSHVPPPAVPELRPAPDSLAGEPSLFQGSLLGEVLHIGFGLDPVGRRGREQVAGQQPLRLGPVTPAPELRQDYDADIPARRGRPGGNRPPAHIADAAIVAGEGYRQVAGIAAEEPVFGEPAASCAHVTEAVPVKGPRGERVNSEPFQHQQIRLPDGAQVDRRHTVMMAALRENGGAPLRIADYAQWVGVHVQSPPGRRMCPIAFSGVARFRPAG